MLQRVFTSQELDCRCLLKGSSEEPQEASVLRISLSKAQIATAMAFSQDSLVDVELQFPDRPGLWLLGQVVRSSGEGLFLRWQHSDDSSAGRLAAALVENAELVAAGNDAEPVGGPASVTTAAEEALAGATGQDALAGEIAASDSAPESTQDSEPDAQVAPTGAAVESASPVAQAPAGGAPPAEAPPTAPTGEAPASAPSEAAAGGRMDVSATLLRSARRVRSQDLAARLQNVSVLDMKTITRLIEQALVDAEDNMRTLLGEEERKRLLEEAEESFRTRLAAFQSQNAGLEARARQLETQLDQARSLLQEEKQRVVRADQFTVSDAGIEQLEKRMERLLGRVLAQNEVTPELADRMREMVARVLDDERERMRVRAQEAQDGSVQLLARKIERLSRALEDTQKAKDRAERRAHLLEKSAGKGLGNVMEAGLDDEDPDHERKIELLKSLIEDNHRVRAHLASYRQGNLMESIASGSSVEAPRVKKIVVQQQAAPPLLRKKVASPACEESEEVIDEITTP